MRWSDIICEGRDAPLYHATDAMRAANILALNRMKAATGSSQAHVNGVSLTRDRTFAHHWWQADWANTGRVVFVLDQARMVQDGLKLQPERHENVKRYGGDQSEEFLVGPMNDVDRYLVAIEITRDTYEDLKTLDARDIGRRGLGMEQPGSARVKAMLRSPKLRVIGAKERSRDMPSKAMPRGDR
jgi:hypothetical protein